MPCASAGWRTAMCCASAWTSSHNDFAGRVATKVMQTALGVRDAVMKFTEVLVYVVGLFHRRADPRRHRRPLADDAAADLARGLCRGLLVFRAPARQALAGAGRHALAGDGPRGRQLHQHPHREALRPCRPRGRLCPRRHGLDAEVGEQLDAHVDADDDGAAGALGRPDLHHVGHVDLAVAPRARSPPAPSPSPSA